MTLQILIAALALAIAVAALYFNAFRRGELELDHVPGGDLVGPGTFHVLPGSAWEMPTVRFVQVALYASNPSVGGAVLEELALTDFRYLGSKPEVFVGLGDQHLAPSASEPEAVLHLPIAVPGRDARVLWLIAEVGPGLGTLNPKNWAKGLATLQGFTATATWTYAQPAPLWWRLVPGRRKRRRRSVTRHLPITVSATSLRSNTIKYWRSKRDVHHEQLANVVEGIPVDQEALRRAAPLGGVRRVARPRAATAARRQ